MPFNAHIHPYTQFIYSHMHRHSHKTESVYSSLCPVDETAFITVFLLFRFLLLLLLHFTHYSQNHHFISISPSMFCSGSRSLCFFVHNVDLSKFIVKYFVAKINFSPDNFNLINIKIERQRNF